MAHDFKNYPELANSQMQIYYFDSPHKQIIEDFEAKVIKVTDGDTIRVTVDFRDFDFPIRMLNIDAPEMNEGGGEAKKWLTSRILGENIEVKMDEKQRVGKWGRLLGTIFFQGMDIGEEMLRDSRVKLFENRNEGKIKGWF